MQNTPLFLQATLPLLTAYYNYMSAVINVFYLHLKATCVSIAGFYFQVNRGPLVNPIWNMTSFTGEHTFHYIILILFP